MNGYAHELLDDYEAALRDLLHFYDKIRGAVGHGEGWTAADVLRLEQIRKMATPVLIRVPERDPRAMEARQRANGSGKPFLSKKSRKTLPRRS